jgi:hypothetical protein
MTAARGSPGLPGRGARRIGPIGSAARIVGGLAAIGVPILLEGVTWWDFAAAFVGLPLTATVASAVLTAAFRRLTAANVAHERDTEPWLRSLLILVVVLAVGIGATFITPLDGGVALWIFIGTSLLIGALRGDAGCEAVAIPNAIAGRRDATGCLLYSPIDSLEARRSTDLALGTFPERGGP